MYSFRNSVKCFVAPQSFIGSPGYNYKEILEFIYNDQNAPTPQDVAAICVKTSENQNNKDRAKILRDRQPNIIDSWKIFAVDFDVPDHDGQNLFTKQLLTLRKLIQEMNRFFDSHERREKVTNGEDVQKFYKFVRSASFDFSENTCMMVDILNWCISILYAHEDFDITRNDIFDLEVTKALKEFRQTCLRETGPSVMLEKTEGPKVYTINDNLIKSTAVINTEPKGYSLFFPMFKLDPRFKHEYRNVLANIQNDKLLNYLLKDWKLFLKKHIDEKIEFELPAEG